MLPKILLLFLFGVVFVSSACVKWHQTENCDPHSTHQKSKDADCSTKINKGRSGYCQCENHRRVREVTCDHFPFTCEDACNEDATASLSVNEAHKEVTCGSVIKLTHHETRFRLHSHSVNYGSGSQQQSVTGHGSRDDVGGYWMVKEGHGEEPCELGDSIKCGATFRLEHLVTHRNLHTHEFASPLSQNDEVSGFGVSGDGDIGDTWTVQCTSNDATWLRDSLVRIKNSQTGKFLASDASVRFNNQNCPRCPILGQQEVYCTSNMDEEKTLWFAIEGIYF